MIRVGNFVRASLIVDDFIRFDVGIHVSALAESLQKPLFDYDRQLLFKTCTCERSTED